MEKFSIKSFKFNSNVIEYNMDTLKKISRTVIQKVFHMDICLPSDFLSIFNQELKNSSLKKHEMEESFSKEIISDIEKSRGLLSSTENIILSTEVLLNKTVDSINKKEDLSDHIVQINKLKESLDNLKESLYLDELTGLYNRKYLNDTFYKDKANPYEGAVVFIDLNKLKYINDNYGHNMGDQLLKFFSDFLLNSLRDHNKRFDLIRFAGDEFIVFIEDSRKNIIELINKLQRKLSIKKLKTNKTAIDYRISFSYGVEEIHTDSSISEAVEKADLNMFKMKNSIKD